MARTQQPFVNDKDRPLYVSVEIWPECFELEPSENLTLVWDAPDIGDTAQINIANDDEIIVWLNGQIDEVQFLIDGKPARDRSWAFKHR